LAEPEPYEGAAVVVCAAAAEVEVVEASCIAAELVWCAAAVVVDPSCAAAVVVAYPIAADVASLAALELAAASELPGMGTAKTALESARTERTGARIRTIV